MNDNEQQLSRLAVHRRTLAHLLSQQAQFESAFIPAYIANSIFEARAEIARIKEALREAGTPVDDEVDDIAAEKPKAQPSQSEISKIIIEGDQNQIFNLDNTSVSGGININNVNNNINIAEANKPIAYKPNISVKYILLGLCAFAQAPLSIQDLQALSPDKVLRRADLRDVAYEEALLLVGDGSQENGFAFAEEQQRVLFIQNELSENECESFQERFISWGQRWYENNNTVLPSYLAQYWCVHVAAMASKKSDLWRLADKILTDLVLHNGLVQQRWAQAVYVSRNNYTDYLNSVELLWHAAELNQQLSLGLRCAMLKSTFISNKSLTGVIISSNWARAEMLAGITPYLTEENRDSNSTRFLQYTEAILDEWSRAEVISKLVPLLPQKEQLRACSMALDATMPITNIDILARILVRLVPYNHTKTRALYLERIIRNKDSVKNSEHNQHINILHDHFMRKWSISHLMAELFISIMVKGLVNLFAGVIWFAKFLWNKITVWACFLCRCITLAAYYIYAIFVATIQSLLKLKEKCSNVIRRIFKQNPQYEYYSINFTDNIADQFHEITGLWPCEWLDDWRKYRDDRTSPVFQGMSISREQGIRQTISSIFHCISKLIIQPISKLISRSRSEYQVYTLQKNINRIKDISDTSDRIEEMAIFLGSRPILRNFHVTPSDIEIACALPDEQLSSWCLVRFLPYVPEHLLARIVTALCSIKSEESRAAALAMTAEYLPFNQIAPVLAILRKTMNEFWRAQALAALADRLAQWTKSGSSEQHQRLVIAHWQETLRDLSSYPRPEFLTSLAALAPWFAVILTSRELDEVAQYVDTITNYNPIL